MNKQDIIDTINKAMEVVNKEDHYISVAIHLNREELVLFRKLLINDIKDSNKNDTDK